MDLEEGSRGCVRLARRQQSECNMAQNAFYWAPFAGMGCIMHGAVTLTTNRQLSGAEACWG
jgi:hypothetical protein